jgi:hypothetical protein
MFGDLENVILLRILKKLTSLRLFANAPNTSMPPIDFINDYSRNQASKRTFSKPSATGDFRWHQDGWRYQPGFFVNHYLLRALNVRELLRTRAFNRSSIITMELRVRKERSCTLFSYFVFAKRVGRPQRINLAVTPAECKLHGLSNAIQLSLFITTSSNLALWFPKTVPLSYWSPADAHHAPP